MESARRTEGPKALGRSQDSLQERKALNLVRADKKVPNSAILDHLPTLVRTTTAALDGSTYPERDSGIPGLSHQFATGAHGMLCVYGYLSALVSLPIKVRNDGIALVWFVSQVVLLWVKLWQIHFGVV